tara:strand:+ start:349 stop:819 length:471 start_codon:yes stop_codon:yes gene_type:complete
VTETEDWKHLHLGLLSFQRGSDSSSEVYWPKHDEWQEWAVTIYRRAVDKANGTTGLGPKCAASWLAMRALQYKWKDLFEFWAERAHKAGPMPMEFIESDLMKRVWEKMVVEERLAFAWDRFRRDYEEGMGFPLHASPLAGARRRVTTPSGALEDEE